MLNTIKLFFSTTEGWSALALIAALAIGAYSYGHSNGYDSGIDTGYTNGQKSRDKEVEHLQDNVAGLTDTINDQRKAVAEKIKKVEAAAADRAVETTKVLNQQIRARDQIIASYKETVPAEVQQHCALSIETVRAVNALIQNVNEDTNEVPAAPIPAADVDTASPNSGVDASRPAPAVKESDGHL